MSNSTTTSTPNSTSFSSSKIIKNISPSGITVKQVQSHTSAASNEFPAIVVPKETPPPAAKRVRRSWKTFFDALPVGGSFTLPGSVRELNSYITAAYNYDMRLSRRRQPGGTFLVTRVG